MFLALGLLLPFATGQIPTIGNMLLPMHIPIILCGMVCGRRWGVVVGLTTPLLRSVLFGMPAIYPTAVAMAVELACYELVMGALYHKAKRQSVGRVYVALVSAMLIGRVAWGLMMWLLMGLAHQAYTFTAFVTSAFVRAVPGILLQLVLIPTIVLLLHRTHVLPFQQGELSHTKNGS
jgi:riboflavin transporter FmnP